MTNSIKVERARKNWTQEDLAKAVGVSRQTIISIESGKFIPSTILAFKIARSFEIELERLFQLEEKD